MTNFIFKSSKGLIKNSPIPGVPLDRKMTLILNELKCQRQDNVDIKLMLNKLLIDKHLQMQVDNYFDKDEPIPEPQEDL